VSGFSEPVSATRSASESVVVDSALAWSPAATGAAETRTQRRWRGVHHCLADAVYDLIVERGDEAFSVIDIAHRADVAQGTFYNHFHDKDEAIDATLRRDFEILLTGITAVRADSLSSLERWMATSGAIVHRVLNNKTWPQFAAVVYQAPRWPSESIASPTGAAIVAGVAEGTMNVTDAKLSQHLSHHLHLGLAYGLASPSPSQLRSVLTTITGAQAALLGINADLVPDLIEWVLPRLADITWD